jgi:hypothetical protein
MGCSCRTFREEPLARPCVSQAEPSFNAGRIARGFPGPHPRGRTSRETHSGGVLVWANILSLVGNPTNGARVS